jgi:hypothetical protein
MSPFQLGVLALGAGVLVVMAGHTWWVLHRHPKVSRRPLAPDPLTEPQEPTLEHAMQTDPVVPPSVARAAARPGLDALIDALAPVSLEHPVSGEAVLAAMPPTRRVGSKPFAIEGLNAQTQRWEAAQAHQRYSQLQAGIQLANRSGALNDIEFSEFVLKTQAFADTVGGLPDFPDMRHEVARARELDQFAGDHDAQLAFVLRARRASWSPAYITQMAARIGFVPGAIPGRLVVPAAIAGHPPLLSLSFDTRVALSEDPSASALRELTLGLDVPQVERGERAFQRLCQAAWSLAREMDAQISDDRGLALPQEAMDVIATELERLYDTLDARDLSAGSVLARRLFS